MLAVVAVFMCVTSYFDSSYDIFALLCKRVLRFMFVSHMSGTYLASGHPIGFGSGLEFGSGGLHLSTVSLVPPPAAIISSGSPRREPYIAVAVDK